MAIDILREIHLVGGLRAIDSENTVVEIGLPGTETLMTIERPEYVDLYNSLTELGLPIVGVNFYQFQEQITGIARPDWLASCSKTGRWAARFRADSWANAKHALLKDGQTDGALIAGKVSEYLWLLEFRILQLSQAYHHALVDHVHLQRSGNKALGGLVDNAWLLEVDAALHGFFVDAGSAADLLAEACCQFLESDLGEIRKLSRLLKQPDRLVGTLTNKLLNAAQPGGWLHAMTKIRNSIVHDQLLSGIGVFGGFEVRGAMLSNDAHIYYLHYPLVGESIHELFNRKKYDNLEDKKDFKDAIDQHLEDVKKSKDALETSQYFLSELCIFFEELHHEAHLESKPPTLTKDDILRIDP